MNILLSCIGRRGYIAEYFRSHLNTNDKIIATGNSELTPGFKYCDLSLIVPDIDSKDYIPSLLKICQKQKINILLSFLDPDIDILCQHLDDFRKNAVIPIIPTPIVNNICFDKYLTYIFFKENNFNTPETYIDFEEAVKDINRGKLIFPLIVKPRRGSASTNLFKSRNINELDAFFHYQPDMIIQQMITGKEYGLDICNDLDGNVLSVIPRTNIIRRFGETMQAQTCNNSTLIDLGLSLGEKLGHVGPLDIDCFIQDNQPYLIELNPRFGGVYPLSHLAGADFPGLILKMVQGETINPKIGEFQSGVIMMKEYKILGGELV
ncbi:ATP-grasp domain-containing protein [Anabaena sp. FACHB-1237]|uniref:ATP-grasp domain-containing protein n=1 Tax=Anabaena sp. FACHB-1237 TaxID=2692769 RepID=UPI001680E08A|nr:ATP-grasp domain-containing protein [Anabaena sp. FACHB-1237]MBD2139651.1 ATP-grasp domain-containing protein [Anabaena sp. FACHB-1237]